MHDEPLAEALDRIAADQSPRALLPQLSGEEQRMAQVAQAIAGARGAVPSTDFVERLHGELVPGARTISRRTAFISGLGAMAAGLLAGIGIDRSSNRGTENPSQPLVGAAGRWVSVARVGDVPHGAVHAFSAGAIQGFVVNRHGQYRALSRICTHMGCRLDFQRASQDLLCPCHGAKFGINGEMRSGPGGYSEKLPALPRLDVRVQGEAIEVWTV